MIRSTSRVLGYYTGSRWIQAAIVVLVSIALSIWLLKVMEKEEERAEKSLVEQTIRNMRTGMQIAMADAIMRHQAQEIRKWVDANPAAWLGRMPPDYRGDCSVEEARALVGGAWCFDVDQRQLVYRPRRHQFLIMSEDIRVDGGKQLRWQVRATDDRAENGGLIGLRIDTVSGHTWEFE